MKKLLHLAIFLLVGIPLLFSETTKFEHVKIRRHKSAEKRELVDKVGVLSFDDEARKLTFRDESGDNLAVPYSDVTKVVFDSDAHMNAGAASVAVAAVSPLAGALVARARVCMIGGSTWSTARQAIRRGCY